MEVAKRKLLTLAFVIDRSVKPNRLLLGEKKTGFGSGYFNGFGGKVEVGETVLEAAHREIKEEANVTVEDLTHQGVILFDFFEPKLVPMQVHVFLATKFQGNPTESSEMRPFWHSLDKPMPFNRMWQDDRLWFPHLLKGQCFIGHFTFRNTTEMVENKVAEIKRENLPEMPPIDSKMHSRHRKVPAGDGTEKKWYEVDSNSLSDSAENSSKKNATDNPTFAQEVESNNEVLQKDAAS